MKLTRTSANASAPELFMYSPTGRLVRADCVSILQAARARAAAFLPTTQTYTKPAQIADFLRAKFSGLDHEVVGVLLLTTGLRIIDYVDLHVGTNKGCPVTAYSVAKHALEHNANAVALVHNHPGQDPNPSEGDIETTKKIREALDILEIRLIDHFVVAGDTVTSIAQLGHL